MVKMNHQVNVYYMCCPLKRGTHREYRICQRQLADKILNYGLRNMFGVDGTGKTIEKGIYGKPYLKGMEQYQYNISNTAGMVVCALSEVCVGVDVERQKPFREGILRKCASQAETAYIMEAIEPEQQQKRFFRLWTLKESYIKMTGEGMRIPLQEVEFRFHGDDEIKCSKEGEFYQKQQENYWISLCAQEKVDVKWIEITNL